MQRINFQLVPKVSSFYQHNVSSTALKKCTGSTI